MWYVLGGVALILVLWVLYDVMQREHTILHNFPIIGHFRYWLEAVGPELRQYIVTDNDEERPFNRDQRRWIYSAAKQQNTYFGFGSDNDMETSPNYIIIKHSAFPVLEPLPESDEYNPEQRIPCAKVLGGARGRKKAYRPASVVNVSGMSFGSLSGRAVEALNRGCAIAGCSQNTGEGGISDHHRHGGDLVFQIGTAYFGVRDETGRFCLKRLVDLVESTPQIRAIEIKLSQGAKPGLGGILPAVKVTPEIARVRGIPAHRDCLSPAAHTAFHDPDSLLDFAEGLADATGLPVGIKSAVGDMGFWETLARLMARTERGLDFIHVDGGEGGTGAGPLAFTDHVALPFKLAFSRVYRAFHREGLDGSIVFGGSGRLGLPEQTALAFAMGCDLVAVGREAMLAIGCIQAQRCQTDHCPTGVTTHNAWLVRGLDPTLKSARLANYIVSLRKKLLKISHACGVVHPALLRPEHVEILDDRFRASTLMELFGYEKNFGLPDSEDREAIHGIMRELYATERGKPV